MKNRRYGMRSILRKVLISVIIISGLYISTTTVLADPTVDIEIEPQNPAPSSTVTFTGIITGDSVTEVFINVIECKGDICFAKPVVNSSMNKNNEGEYQLDVTLSHSDADSIKYWTVVKSNGNWYDFQQDETLVLLSTSSGTNNGTSNNTPGFELLIMLLSVAILIFIIKRKRDI
jgi:hypothetical protein